ncbi:MAG: hypothetical protein M1448_04060 [Candidatus Marsarchaeota archaeon]|jgi:hypothetical protein|nr:hypothetical protein [Candidatus Marsarchaeota archaeon]
MITGFTIKNVEGKIESAESLSRQRFPRLNVNIEKVDTDHDKINVGFSFVADYFDGDEKSSKSIGSIKLSGDVELKEPKEAVDTTIKRWNENKSLPNNIAEELVNGLNFRCSATGTLVAYSLGLIPPLVISTTKIEEKK